MRLARCGRVVSRCRRTAAAWTGWWRQGPCAPLPRRAAPRRKPGMPARKRRPAAPGRAAGRTSLCVSTTAAPTTRAISGRTSSGRRREISNRFPQRSSACAVAASQHGARGAVEAAPTSESGRPAHLSQVRDALDHEPRPMRPGLGEAERGRAEPAGIEAEHVGDVLEVGVRERQRLVVVQAQVAVHLVPHDRAPTRPGRCSSSASHRSDQVTLGLRRARTEHALPRSERTFYTCTGRVG